MFEGIKGTSGVIALDDIQYTLGIDCAKQVTDQVTSKMVVVLHDVYISSVFLFIFFKFVVLPETHPVSEKKKNINQK